MLGSQLLLLLLLLLLQCKRLLELLLLRGQQLFKLARNVLVGLFAVLVDGTEAIHTVIEVCTGVSNGCVGAADSIVCKGKQTHTPLCSTPARRHRGECAGIHRQAKRPQKLLRPQNRRATLADGRGAFILGAAAGARACRATTARAQAVGVQTSHQHLHNHKVR